MAKEYLIFIRVEHWVVGGDASKLGYGNTGIHSSFFYTQYCISIIPHMVVNGSRKCEYTA